MYKFLVNGSSNCSPVSKRIWVKHVPPRVQFFGWLAWKGKLKTAEFLHRIGVLPAGTSVVCCLCKSGTEFLIHVLLLCPVAWRVWYEMLRWWKVQGALPASVEDILEWWLRVGLTKKERMMWNAIPLVVMWSLWKHRNECLFREVVPSVDGITDLIKLKMAVWFKEVFKEHMFSIHNFIFNLERIKFSLGGG